MTIQINGNSNSYESLKGPYLKIKFEFKKIKMYQPEEINKDYDAKKIKK